MSENTNISWTNDSWNPIVGCSIVSPGCTNCYAMRMAHRIKTMEDGRTGRPDASHYFGTTKVVNGNPVWTGVMRQAPEHILLQPLKWKKPRKIFVNSMSDLFHEDVPDEWIDRVFAVMALCPQHTFQILTKRSKRMREWLVPERVAMVARHITFDIRFAGHHAEKNWSATPLNQIEGDLVQRRSLSKLWPLPNVWLGVSCEDQKRADERIPDLLDTPAAVRFVSAEPLLGPIDFTMGDLAYFDCPSDCEHGHIEWDTGAFVCRHCNDSGKSRDFGLDWIIVGGESGPGHRPMQIEWAEAIRQQCEAAGTAFFFKQDSGSKPGQRGRASDALWACKQFPVSAQ